jgi:hypothetical protein
MLPTVALFLFFAGITIAAVLLFMFVTVLREGPAGRQKAVAPQQWRPPLAPAAELKVWAARVAESVTKRSLVDRRDPERPAKLLEELLQGATFAIHQVPDTRVTREGDGCANCKHETIGATAPEILAIADRVRSEPQLAERVHELASANALAAADWDVADSRRAQFTCPLYTPEGSCASYPLRPLHCRAVCPECCPEANPNASGTPLPEVARSIGLGAELGLMAGVSAAGLDARRYELNSALAAALPVDNATEQWLRGDNVFAGCQECG